MNVRWAAAVAATLLLDGCTAFAVVTPVNDLAQQAGLPTIQFRAGFSTGPVKMIMPDGEVLTGSFDVAVGGGFATAFAGGITATATEVSAGGNFFASASGPHTNMVCHGNVSFGHGGGICRTVEGAEYQIQF